MAENSQQQILEEQKAQCPMCKIVSGEIPALKVYETNDVLAIMDINPAAKGHVLVVPKEHYPIIQMMPQPITKSLFAAVKDVSKCVEEAMISQGTSVMIASGAAAGQQLPHVIVHIIPRENNDNLEKLDLQKQLVISDEDKQKLQSALTGTLNAKSGKLSKQQVVELIQKNSQLKDAILKNSEEFKKIIPQHPQLKTIFANVNIDEIIKIILDSEKKDNSEEIIDLLGGKK